MMIDIATEESELARAMNRGDIEPLRPEVQLHWASLRQDGLSLITAVVDALCRAGHGVTADAFLLLADDCQTDHELERLIRCTVTVL